MCSQLAVRFKLNYQLREGVLVGWPVPGRLDYESIMSVSMTCQNLVDDGVKDVLDALVQGKFTRVTRIQLFENNLSDVSVERIAQALKTNSTVTHVDLVSSLPIYLLLLQSSCFRSLQYVTRAVCTELQPRNY